MTPSERLLLAAIGPLMPQIEKHLQPALEMFIEGRLKTIDEQKNIEDAKPVMLICQDSNGTIYLCDALVRGKELTGIIRRISLEVLARQIVSNLTKK